jgi:hypothetical protein
LQLKQIDHDPAENKNLPGQMERQWARHKYGRDATPADLFYYVLPFAAIAVAMFLWRGY